MKPLSFIYEAHPARVAFGDGAIHKLAEECERLGVRRALVIVSPRLEDEVGAIVGARSVATLTNAAMHVPADVARDARAIAARSDADGIVAVGGGSVVGLAKAVARENGLPIVAAPTTYAGSEMTSIWGITEGGQKRTGRDPRVRPRTVLYDPQLSRALPSALAATSGLNAIAHAMEALYAREIDPITLLFAEEAVTLIARHLPVVVAGGATASAAAHTAVLCGAWLGGTCLDRATMGVHHKLCHVLGGTFGLPHASVHSVILPYAAAFNRDAAPYAMRRLARALGSDDAPRALFALGRTLGTPPSLSALGMRREDLARAADIATQSPYENPRPVDRAGMLALLEDAFIGREPDAGREAT